MRSTYTPLHPIVAAACLALSGCATDAAPPGDGLTLSAKDQAAQEPNFEAVVVRAYPESKYEYTSPYDMTIAPGQRRVHVVLQPDQEVGSLDLYFRDRKDPELVLTRAGEAQVIAEGRFLRDSVTFELGAPIRDIDPGLWQLEIHVGEAVVAALPDVLVVAAGDVDRDGRFSSNDLVLMMQEGKYETGQPATADDGDVNGDGLFTSADMVVMFGGKGDVVYDGAPYPSKPSVRDQRQGADGKWVVGDYSCWLAAYGPIQHSFHEDPGVPDDQRDNYSFNLLTVDRSCSASSYLPGTTDPVDMAFPDPSNPSFLHARCNFGGSSLKDANEDLAEIGETYSEGHAIISGEYSHHREVVMHCEPEYFFAFDDEWVIQSDGSKLLGIPRMTENEACRVTVDVVAEGTARAFADGKRPDQVTMGDNGEVDIPVPVPAESETKVSLEFPDISQLADGDETGKPSVAPAGYLLSGSSKAFSPKKKCAETVADDVKCEVGVQLGDGPLGFGPKVECFAEVSGASLVSSIMGCASALDEPALAIMHLARSKMSATQQPQYDGPITTRKDLVFTPVTDGPFRQALGNIAVRVTHSAESNSKLVSDGVANDPLIHISQATSVSEGRVRVSLSVQDVPDPPDGLTFEEEQEYWKTHYSHCQVIDPPGPGSLEGASFMSEQKLQGEVVMQRGRSVGVNTLTRDWRYYVERNTGDAYPLFMKQ